MSQPPTPFQRSYSFTGWSLTHPGEQQPGNQIDGQLDDVAASLQQTINRLNEIQRDDGLIRTSALSSSIDALTSEAALQACQKVYADNLAVLSDKAAARMNLQISTYFPAIDGSSLWISNADWPSGGVWHNSTQPGQWGGASPSNLPTSTYTSRRFRSAVLFGTRKDWATRSGIDQTNNGQPTDATPDATERVDNVSMALLFAGTRGIGGASQNTTGCWAPNPGYESHIVASYNLSNPWIPADDEPPMLDRMPSAVNPLATVFQVSWGLKQLHDSIPYALIPSINQKAALDGASNPSATNPFATLADVLSSGAVTANVGAALAASESPSATNPFVTNLALESAISSKADAASLTAGLAAKADVSHQHAPTDIIDPLGFAMGGANLADWTAAKDSEISTLQTGKADAAATETALAGKADASDHGIAKAWVSFDGSVNPPVIKASKGITSVARNGTGIYTLSLSGFSSPNYCWTGSGRSDGSSGALIVCQNDTYKTQTASSLQIVVTGDGGSARNATLVNVVIHA